MRTTLIYDAHGYLGNNPVWAQTGLPVPFEGPDWIKMMDSTGFDGALVAPPGVGAPDDYLPDMDRIAAAIKEFPGRIFGMCRLKPSQGQKALDQLRFRVEEQGFHALKMNTLDDNYRLDDRRLLDPIFELAAELGILMYFHTGDSHGETCQPSMVADVAVDFPSANFSIGHCGYPGWTDQLVPALRKAPNARAETAGLFSPAAIQEIIDEVGADRIMIGSNGPNSPIDLPYIMVNKHMNKLTDQEKALVVGGNFRKAIRLDN